MTGRRQGRGEHRGAREARGDVPARGLHQVRQVPPGGGAALLVPAQVEGDGQGVGALRVRGHAPSAVGEAGPEGLADGVRQLAVARGVVRSAELGRPLRDDAGGAGEEGGGHQAGVRHGLHGIVRRGRGIKPVAQLEAAVPHVLASVFPIRSGQGVHQVHPGAR